MADVVKASDCKCCECGGQAVAFWPLVDPDIPSHPYCRKCLDKAKQELFIRLCEIDSDLCEQKEVRELLKNANDYDKG